MCSSCRSRPRAADDPGEENSVNEDRIPILVGAAQLVERQREPSLALEPLAMLEQVVRGAAEDAELGPSALHEIDTLGLVDIMTWHPSNGPRLLADRLGARPRRELACGIGGETPVVMINELARQIARGESKLAVAAGCNTLETSRLARKAGVMLNWTLGGEGEPEMLVASTVGSSDLEAQYGLNLPTNIYPLFENALRAGRGLDLASHRRRMGELFSPFSEVAARNPHAWFPQARSPHELTRVTERNRMVAFPYPKYLNAVLQTNQGAAVLLTSVAHARELGIPEAKWVYWLAGARARERAWFASERPSFAACPALRAATLGALDRAEMTLEQVDHIDLYSCFPSAVSMACKMLDIAEDDPRGLTVTGGLPYAGGPGNSYCLHAAASMMEALREDRGSRGLVTGNGWYLTKHAALLLSSAAPRSRPDDEVDEPAPNPGDDPALAPVPIAARADGPASVETYTVLFGRGGDPERGIVIGRLDSGERFLANTPQDTALLTEIMTREWVGATGRVVHANGHNRFDPD